ncbi:MAG: recombinase family protein [Bacteroidota bacterium]
MIFGYIRVSTRDQKVDRQILELHEECDEVFIDRVSGRKAKRPELSRMMDKIRAKDEILVMRLARFGRSTKDLMNLADKIISAGATLRSKKEGFQLDGSPMGKMLYTIMAALAEFEVDVIRERTMEGLRAAAAKGRRGGRPKGLSDEGKKKAKLVAQLYHDPDWSIRQIAEHLGIATTSIYNYLRHEKIKVGRKYKKTSTPA